MAGDEPVTSPDQHKPGPRRAARVGAVGAIILLLCMTWPVQQGHIATVFLLVGAGLIALLLVVDVVLRKSGLRPDR
ncbi:MAG TPA: hypothetical protein VHA75_05000 [Rugosimonospora sp.]|nr:hypothetical protein [Rugosimonospora sp.]